MEMVCLIVEAVESEKKLTLEELVYKFSTKIEEKTRSDMKSLFASGVTNQHTFKRERSSSVLLIEA